MNREHSGREAETAILLRMAASREALLAANSAPPTSPTGRGQKRSPTASLIASLADAPRVALLLAISVGAIVLGPRRTIDIVTRAGITAGLGSAARKAIAGGV